MSAVPATTLNGPLVQGIRRHLEGLKSTPDGAALYMMIERGLRRYGGAEQMEHAFLDFLHGMLARHAKDPNTDPATRVKARMIQQRLALALPKTPQSADASQQGSPNGGTPPPADKERGQPAAGKPAGGSPDTPSRMERTTSASGAAGDHTPASDRAKDSAGPAAYQELPARPSAENGASSANPARAGDVPASFRTPFAEGERTPMPRFEEIIVRPETPRVESERGSVADAAGEPVRQSAEPEKFSALEETLVEKVTETITFNREFDEIVKTEQSAIERADKAIGDFNDLKQLLVRGLDDLVRERDELKERLSTAAEFLKSVEADRRKLKGELGRLRKQALADELTGLPKREVFVRSLEAEISRVRRYGFALALAVLDVDGLERINTQFGRQAGDAVLRSYANEILANFRTYDLVARYGEDEFAVLFPNTQKEGALRALEKAQKRASETYLSHDGRSFPIPTFSSVLTLYSPGERPEQLLRRAEDALHHAKLKGQARMVVALPGA